MLMTRRLLLVSAAVVLASGCATLPDRSMSVSPPSQWASADAGTEAPVVLDWWTVLADRDLDALVEQALGHNADLRVANANLRAAGALAGQAETAFLPRGQVTADLQRTRVSGLSQPPFEGSPDTFPTQTLASVGAQLSWEIDLFGGMRAAQDAAEAREGEALWLRRDVEAAVAAAVVRAWAEHNYLAAAEALMQTRIDLLTDALEMTGRARTVGGVSDNELELARAALETARSALPSVQTARRSAARRIEILCGQVPHANLTAGLPGQSPASINAGDPAAMLRRRPDVAAAERAFAAAAAEARIAVADLYPRIALTGQVSRTAEPGQLGSAGALGFGVGPSLTWGLFDYPRQRLRMVAADAQAEGALARWEGKVLSALEEAEGALDGWRSAQAAAAATGRALGARETALQLMQRRERAGQVSRLERTRLEAEVVLDRENALALRRDELLSWISAQLALGAGWRDHGLAAVAPARPAP